MSEPKFTPGPWKTGWQENRLLFPFVWQERGYAVAKLCGKPKNPHWPVCSERDYVDPEKVKANAALIAAAPEMYEELADLLDAMENGLFPQVAPGVDYPNVSQKKQQLRKLLQKARGEG